MFLSCRLATDFVLRARFGPAPKRTELKYTRLSFANAPLTDLKFLLPFRASS